MNFPPYLNKSSGVTKKYEETDKYQSTNSDIFSKNENIIVQETDEF